MSAFRFRVTLLVLIGLGAMALSGCFGPIERPVADFTWCPDGYAGALDYRFTSTSTSQQGTWIDEVVWEFGDGTAPVSWDGWHRFSEEGTYPVTLTVTDSRGLSGTVTKHVPIEMAVFIHPNWSLTLGWPVRISGVAENRSDYNLDSVLIKAKFYDTDGVRILDGTVTIEDMEPGEKVAFSVDATEFSALIFHATVAIDAFFVECDSRWLIPVDGKGGE